MSGDAGSVATLTFRKKSMIIAVDFDGTCVSHDYPYIGKEIGAAPVLRELVSAGHELILFTMRDGKTLKEAEAEGAMPLRQSLNGTWRFSYAKNPSLRVKDFYKKEILEFMNLM